MGAEGDHGSHLATFDLVASASSVCLICATTLSRNATSAQFASRLITFSSGFNLFLYLCAISGRVEVATILTSVSFRGVSSGSAYVPSIFKQPIIVSTTSHGAGVRNGISKRLYAVFLAYSNVLALQ